MKPEQSLLSFIFSLLLTSSNANPVKSCPPASNKCAKDASFTLHDITYSSDEIYSTPAHLAVSEGTISFNLTNTAVGYTTHCTASSDQACCYFYGDIVYTCDAPPPSAAAGAGASFTFATNTGAFTVNETWGCHGDKYLGLASGTATLDCKTDFWQNPNWTIGELYSTKTVTCTPTDLTLPATVKET